MNDTFNLVDNPNKECENNALVQLWVRWFGIGCEACAFVVIAFISAILLSWALMYLLS